MILSSLKVEQAIDQESNPEERMKSMIGQLPYTEICNDELACRI